MEIWKDNVLDKITKGTLMVSTVEELFTKIRQEFGEFDEESRKVDELRVLEQGSKTVDEYVHVMQPILVTGIKPTVPLSVIDKENSLESSLY